MFCESMETQVIERLGQESGQAKRRESTRSRDHEWNRFSDQLSPFLSVSDLVLSYLHFLSQNYIKSKQQIPFLRMTANSLRLISPSAPSTCQI